MHFTLSLALILPILATLASPMPASEPPLHELWRQGGDRGFQGWSLSGVRQSDGRLLLDPLTAEQVAGSTDGPSLQTSWVGTALGPERETTEAFRELIPSWNARTIEGTWVRIRLRARMDGRWSGWYILGLWSSAGGSEPRQSVAGQDDADARVLTDTLALRAPAQAYQLELALYSVDDARSPEISLASVLASRAGEGPGGLAPGRGAWGTILDVPQRSQMAYPGGGEVWCSPTSTSMVMAYWSARLDQPGLDRTVPEVAAGTYDPIYRGHGNWPFNTAYASHYGLVAYVSRFSTLRQVEQWIEVGAPVVASLAWVPGELANAPIPSTNGHLLVIVGFTPQGDVVANDPAGDPRRGQSVQRTYERNQFERLWLTHSTGTVYLIHPAQQPLPADGALGAW